jgi:hypothetical protein
MLDEIGSELDQIVFDEHRWKKRGGVKITEVS